MRRHPPDILITTPESLYLMLTSQAREIFEHAEQVIVDEIHAVAQTKRGAHLAITLERLAEQAGPRRPAHRPLRDPEPAGGGRPLPRRPQADVHDRRHGHAQAARPEDPRAGREHGRAGAEGPRPRPVRRRRGDPQVDLARDLPRDPRSWSASTAPRSSSSTTGAPPSASRCASTSSPRSRSPAPTTARSPARSASSSRSSSRPASCPASWPPSSLELGIDMGAVDLVLQVESPKSVTAGLQRIGRSGHGVGDTAKGRIFPKFRADLLECAVVARRMREGLIERTVVPRNPLDVLAQQVVAMAASVETLAVDELHALLLRTYSFGELSPRAAREHARHARRPLPERGVRRAAPAHRLGPRRGHDPRAQGRPRARHHQRGHDPRPRPVLRQPPRRPPRRRARRGDGLRGAARPGLPARRARAGGSRRSRATASSSRPRRASPAPSRSGRATASAGPKELGEAIGAFARWAVEQEPEALAERLRPRPARRAEPDRLPARAAGGHARRARATARSSWSASATRSATGACACSRPSAAASTPPGASRSPPGSASSSASSPTRSGPTTASSSTCPTPTSRPGAELVLVEPDELEDLVVGELGGSALFGARFRENAGRALLIPRAYPGRRTPLWQQRLKSQTLLEVAKRYGQFPIVLETYRECLRDVLDVPGLHDLLRKLHSRELSVVEVETPTASPFASSLLFDYVATYMYESDQPNAERRAAALALDRELLRELLGQEELRDLIDPGALDTVEADLQRRSERTRADSADALHDVLRRVGDLTEVELAPARRARAPTSPAGCAALEARAPRDRPARRRRGALGRGRGRGPVPRRARRRAARRPAGAVPRGRARTRWSGSSAASPAPTARSRARLLKERYGLDLTPVLAGPRARGRARPRRAAPRRHGARVVRPRGPAPPAPRLARRAARGDRARRPARARPLPAELAGRRPPPARRRRDRPAARGARAAAGPRAARRGLGARRAPAPRSAPTAPSWLDQLCASGEVVWVGRRRARPPQRQGRALLPRRRGRARPAARGARASSTTSPPTPRSAPGSPRAPASSPTCSSTSPASPARSSRRRCGISSGPAR